MDQIPSVVELDAWQLGESVLLILGAKGIVDGGRGEESSHTKGGGDDLVVFADDGMGDGRVESVHEAGGKEDRRGWRKVILISLPVHKGQT